MRNTIAATMILSAVEHNALADDAKAPKEAAKARPAIEKVVITAQRREESLQDVPISVAAYSEGMIAERNITSLMDVSISLPGFVSAQNFGQVVPTIRGIGSSRFSMSAEPGVAMYVDDIYLGRPYLPQATLSQIERIEVLKGPQGTLYGRNTSGGAVKIVTRRPTDAFEFSGAIQGGNYDHFSAEASMSGPLTDTLRGRLSVFKEERDGYTYNAARDEVVDAHESESGRISLDWAPLYWLDVTLNADINNQFDTGPSMYAAVPTTFSSANQRELSPAFAPYDAALNPLLAALEPGDPLLDLLTEALTERIGGRNSTTPRTIHQDAPTYTDIDSQTASSTLSMAIAGIDFKLIAGYADSTRDFPNDSDLTDMPAITMTVANTTGRQASGELQASSSFDMPWGNELRWLAGAFYYEEKASEVFNFEVISLLDILGIDDPAIEEVLNTAGNQIPSQPSALLQNGGAGQILFDAEQLTRSRAAFVDLEWDVASWLILRLGARYTEDTKKLLKRTARNVDPNIGCENESGEETFDATTMRAGIDIPFDDERMVYASYSQGFKAGGFSGISCGTGPYDPEHVDAVEVGLKSQWFDRSLQLNLAAFEYDFTDIQVDKVVGFATEVENAAQATISGAEISLEYRPFAFMSLDIGAAYLDATYDEFSDNDPFTLLDDSEEDLSGNRLNNAPEWSGSIGAGFYNTLDSGTELSARIEWSYTDEMFYDHFNHEFARADAYEIWNLYLTWDMPQNGLTVRGFGKNLKDELYISGIMIASATVGSPYLYYGAPRTYGFEVEYRFEGL